MRLNRFGIITLALAALCIVTIACFGFFAVARERLLRLERQVSIEAAAQERVVVLIQRDDHLVVDRENARRRFESEASGKGNSSRVGAGPSAVALQQQISVLSKELDTVHDELKQATAEAEAERIRHFEIEKTQLLAKNQQDRLRDITRIGLALVIMPFALYILLNKKSSTAQRTIAGSALAALLGFWFSK